VRAPARPATCSLQKGALKYSSAPCAIGEPATEWRCPCCRGDLFAATVSTVKNRPEAAGQQYVSPNKAQQERTGLGSPSKHQAVSHFFAAAEASLRQDVEKAEGSQTADSQGQRSGCGCGCQSVLSTLESSFPCISDKIVLAVAALRLRTLVDPSKPSLSKTVARYVGAIVLTVASLAAGTVMLQLFLRGFGQLACIPAGPNFPVPQRQFDSGAQTKAACLVVIPDDMWMSALLALAGAYISIAMARALGVSMRRVFTQFDKLALRCILCWWTVTFSYAILLFAMRYVFTILGTHAVSLMADV
jgi:hypothetical protein